VAGDVKPRPVPPWTFIYKRDGSKRCVLCGDDHRTIVESEHGDGLGVCESCAVHAYWLWHAFPRDAEPSSSGDAAVVEAVRVLLLRLKKFPGDEVADPEFVGSYEVAMVEVPGGLDLPSGRVEDGESEVNAATAALAAAGVETWRPFLEVLYRAASPRGRFASVVLATAWTKIPDWKGKSLQWKGWPPWDHAEGTKVLYMALETVLGIRLWKYARQEPRPDSLCVQVREGAAKYASLRRKIRAGATDVDTSMMEIMLRGMSDDEKIVDRLLRESEEREDELRRQREEEAAAKEEEKGEETGDDQHQLPGLSPPDPDPGDGEGDGGEDGGEDDPFGDEP